MKTTAIVGPVTIRQLSQYTADVLRAVRKGQVILVSQDGEVVAFIHPITPDIDIFGDLFNDVIGPDEYVFPNP